MATGNAPPAACWGDVRTWDASYYLHPFKTLGEYAFIPVERAEGSYLYLADGSRVLDFLSQYFCVNLGQGHPRVRQAIREATERYTFLSEPWASDYRARAAKLIVHDLLGAEGWASHVRFVATGTEAVELALIMAKLFTGRPHVVTQEFSYHGWTQGAAGATGLRGARGNTSTPDGEIRDVPGYPTPGYYLAPAPRCSHCDCARKDGKVLPCVQQTESLIRSIGPETVAAFISEVSLAAGGIHPPPEYVLQIRELTERLGILWIDDEVLCGFGRLGTWFGYQNYPGVSPDLMTLGKGLSGAAMPAAGVVVRNEIGDFFSNRRWWLSSTMAAHPVSMAAVVATIETMIEEKAVENAATLGRHLGSQLRKLAARHPSVGHVDGSGLLWMVELVKNKRTGERFVADDRFAMGAGDLDGWPVEVVTRHCLERGVFLTGLVPNTLALAPPLNVSRQECDHALSALDSALSKLDARCDQA